MCGIFGWALGAANRQNGETLARLTNLMAHRGPDGAGYNATRHRRRTLPDRARSSPPVDHRHRRRPAADVERGRPLHRRLQRRDLQLHRAPRRAACARPRFRTTSDTEVLIEAFRAWDLEAIRPISRHVRLRPLGQGNATARARARRLRQEAAVPCHAPECAGIRIGDRAPRSIPRDRPQLQCRRARPLSAQSLRSGPRHLLPRGDQAPARSLCGVEGRQSRHHPLLHAALRRHHRPTSPPSTRPCACSKRPSTRRSASGCAATRRSAPTSQGASIPPPWSRPW